MKTRKNCLTCKKEFIVWHFEIETRSFCSRACYWKSLEGKAAWNKGIKTGISPWKNKKRSEETKEKIRQSLRKGKYINCKICKKRFFISPSSILVGKKYCSEDCQYNDKQALQVQGINTILKLQDHKGLNKLELKGRAILQDIGIEFEEQVPMFDKFLVDVLVPSKKLVIQWDGEYWHDKRKSNDMSQDRYLNKCGYRVLRITDKQIEKDISSVYSVIRNCL